jgi:hypothetical protein
VLVYVYIHAIQDTDCFDRTMWPPKQPNAVPSESESRALMKLLEQQQTIVSSIEKFQMESDAERQRLSGKIMTLQETLNSVENLKKLGLTTQSDSIPLLDALSKEFSALETKRDFLLALFPEAMTFLSSFSAANDAINLLKSTLEISLGQLQSLFTIVAQEFYSTEMLCAQTTDAIASFSGMVSTVRQSISLKQNGVLHPLRKLPEETLVQIFDWCVDEEAQEWLEFGSVLRNPKVPTRIAGVCRRWRGIALSHTRLWRHVLAPRTVTERYRHTYNDYRNRNVEKGINHFRHALALCQGGSVELTIPTGVIFPTDIDVTMLKVERLNLLNASQIWHSVFPWPPGLPSPKHLWLGQPATNTAFSREIPLSLISKTSKITSFSISLTFPSPINTVTHLVLGGQLPTLPINTLLRSLPCLVMLDAKGACLSSAPVVNLVQSNVHSHLRTIGVDGSGLAFLEQALVEGLRLPNLYFFEIANLRHLATNYPSISTHTSGCIIDLSIFGTEGIDEEALRTFIDILPRLDTLSLHGAATEPALQALYRATSSDGGSDVKYSMPEAVRRIVICDYQGNGEAIHQRLREIRADEGRNCESIKVIFQDCLNIRPDIRKDLCSSPAIQLTGPPK